MNCLILGWVTKAMVNIISTSLGISDAKALAICVFFLMPFTGIYVSLGGVWGVGGAGFFFIFLQEGVVNSPGPCGGRAGGGGYEKTGPTQPPHPPARKQKPP